jgi:hypothetical protein
LDTIRISEYRVIVDFGGVIRGIDDERIATPPIRMMRGPVCAAQDLSSAPSLRIILEIHVGLASGAHRQHVTEGVARKHRRLLAIPTDAGNEVTGVTKRIDTPKSVRDSSHKNP